MNSSDLHERIIKHPGMPYYNAIKVSHITLDIFLGNAKSLRFLIKELESSESQKKFWVSESSRSKEHSEIVRKLHNFLSSVGTLTDHYRALMRLPCISEDHRKEYSETISKIFTSDPLSRFIKDFRNYILHRNAPFVGHNYTIHPPPEKIEIFLSLSEMRSWDKWSPPARQYITANLPNVCLASMIDLYVKRRCAPFIEWFQDSFSKFYSKELRELDHLQTEWNDNLKKRLSRTTR